MQQIEQDHLAVALPICAVICFSLAMLICDGQLFKQWGPMSWFYGATAKYPLLRAVIVCGILSTAGSVMAAIAFNIDGAAAFCWIATSTMISHIFIAQTYQQKIISTEVYALAGVIVILVFLFGIQMGRLPSKDQEKVTASAEKAITLQATSE